MNTFRLLLLLSLALAAFGYAQGDYFLPFMQKATAPITVDGNLDEWNFCFPINMNQETTPVNSRARSWFPEDNVDCSGTIMMMWDENYLYLAAHVMDDVPGVNPNPTPGWRADCVELYLGNYDVGNVPWAPQESSVPDGIDGRYAMQLSFQFDANGDSAFCQQWTPFSRQIKSANTAVKGVLWPQEDGYNIEAKVAWEDLASTTTGNTFDLTGGMILPCTFSLYDVDDWINYDFQGYAFSESSYPAYVGPGRGWQVIEVKGAREEALYEFSSPFMKQAKTPVTVDGNLDEWSFCFPVDLNQTSIPADSRCHGWWPVDNDDLAGVLNFMWDADYLYFAANVRDDVPGVSPAPGWRADAIELYLGNYDIGEYGIIPDHTGIINEGDMLDSQLAAYYDSNADTTAIRAYSPVDGYFHTANTIAKGKLWPQEDGYVLEGRISLKDIAERDDVDLKQRTFDFEANVGSIFPATYSLYDVDDWINYDFQGYQYAVAAPYEGPGNGSWTGIKIVGTCLYEELDHLWGYTDVKSEKIDRTPSAFDLRSNYPNPFNPSTNFEFDLTTAGNVTLDIYNLRGELVKTCINNERMSTGSYRITLDMSDSPSGVYMAVLQQSGQRATQKIMLLK
jgi:hypothetical protein